MAGKPGNNAVIDSSTHCNIIVICIIDFVTINVKRKIYNFRKIQVLVFVKEYSRRFPEGGIESDFVPAAPEKAAEALVFPVYVYYDLTGSYYYNS